MFLVNTFLFSELNNLDITSYLNNFETRQMIGTFLFFEDKLIAAISWFVKRLRLIVVVNFNS